MPAILHAQLFICRMQAKFANQNNEKHSMSMATWSSTKENNLRCRWW